MSRRNQMGKRKTTAGLMRNIFRHSLYALWAIFVPLLLLELVLRTTHLFGARLPCTERDPLIGYRFSPNHAYWYKAESDHPITGRINKYGWRDKDWALVKTPGTYRIAVLGDSFVEAFQVESDRTFLSLAAKRLTAKLDRPVEMMNFGRSGFTQSEEFLVLQRDVARFRPDMVMVLFFPQNDIADIRRETAAEDYARPFYHLTKDGRLSLVLSAVRNGTSIRARLVDASKHNSALVSLISEKRKKLRALPSRRQEGAGHGNGLKPYLTLTTRAPDSVFASNYRVNKALIRAMADLCKARRIRLMLVCVDIEGYRPEVEARWRRLDPSVNVNFFEDDLARYAGSLGIEYVGLQRAFRRSYQESGTPLHFGTWGHWNPRGHELVADIMVRKLQAEIKH